MIIESDQKRLSDIHVEGRGLKKHPRKAERSRADKKRNTCEAAGEPREGSARQKGTSIYPLGGSNPWPSVY